MSIFEFHIAERNLESSEINELEIASRLFRCPVEIQGILIDIAVSGQAVIRQEGVKKGAEIIEALSSAPFVIKNDFDILCEPLYSKIESVDNTLFIRGSKTRFYKDLAKMVEGYDLPLLSFKNQSTCRFFFNWIKNDKASGMILLYSELRTLLDLKKENYKAFVHYQRVLSTVQRELKGVGVVMKFSKFPKNEKRSSGVEIEIEQRGKL